MTQSRGEPLEVRAERRGEEVVISADKPIPAEVVRDRRDTKWKRITFVVFALLTIYILVNQQIIGASNNHLLHEASKQRTDLLKSQIQLLDKLNEETDRNAKQAQTIDDLYQIVVKEYQLLKAMGLTDAQIQKAVGEPVPKKSPSNSPSPQPQKSPSPSPSSSTHPKPHPSPSHSPKPSPSPTQTCLIHDPLTGRCIANVPIPKAIRGERFVPRYEF